MILESSNSPTGLLLSGGLDSAILLGRLLDEGHRVRPFYVRSGLAWQREELRATQRLLRAVRRPQLAELAILDLPLSDLYEDHWSMTGDGAPDAASADDAVYLPGRNPLLIVKAAVWCGLNGIDRLALAVLRSNPFGDATAEFFEHFEAAMRDAIGRPIQIVRPLGRLGKREVMAMGRGLPLELTFSCIAPREGLHCGQCNKCAERMAAFRLTDIPDPTCYAADPLAARD